MIHHLEADGKNLSVTNSLMSGSVGRMPISTYERRRTSSAFGLYFPVELNIGINSSYTLPAMAGETPMTRLEISTVLFLFWRMKAIVSNQPARNARTASGFLSMKERRA